MQMTEALANPSGKFAVRITTDCMVPRCHAGDWARVDTIKRITDGCDVMLTMRETDAAGQPLTLLRRLVRKSRAGWLVKQYTPQLHRLIRPADVAAAYRVTGYSHADAFSESR